MARYISSQVMFQQQDLFLLTKFLFVSAIFYQIFVFHQMIAFQKLVFYFI